MVWSQFTKDNIKHFKINRYSLQNNNQLLKSMRSERQKIKKFIRKYPKFLFDVSSKSSSVIDNKIKEYAHTSWVDTENVVDQVNQLPETHVIAWESFEDETYGINKITIKSDSKCYSNFLSRIKIMILFIEYIKNKTNNTNKCVDIYLVLSDLRKKIPENNELLGIKNVNSGYTDFSKNIIFIWRLEEFEKVLFHELVHYFDLDRRDERVGPIIDKISEPSYYESITDFLGIYYHLIYLSLLSRVSIKLLLNLELTFIKNQALRVNDYLKLGQWTYKPTKEIKQYTPAFSYYILKYLIFEYALNNNLSKTKNYNDLLKKVMKLGIPNTTPTKIDSLRMTLLQLL